MGITPGVNAANGKDSPFGEDLIDVVFYVFRASLLFGLFVRVNETYFGNARMNECLRHS